MCISFRRCGSFWGPIVLQVCLATLIASSARAEGWSRVVVQEPLARIAVHKSLDGAVQWWAQSRCQTLLTEFRDEEGCPLAERLAAIGTTFAQPRYCLHQADMCAGSSECSPSAP